MSGDKIEKESSRKSKIIIDVTLFLMYNKDNLKVLQIQKERMISLLNLIIYLRRRKNSGDTVSLHKICNLLLCILIICKGVNLWLTKEQ